MRRRLAAILPRAGTPNKSSDRMSRSDADHTSWRADVVHIRRQGVQADLEHQRDVAASDRPRRRTSSSRAVRSSGAAGEKLLLATGIARSAMRRGEIRHIRAVAHETEFRR
jgi:hypothetical protein